MVWMVYIHSRNTSLINLFLIVLTTSVFVLCHLYVWGFRDMTLFVHFFWSSKVCTGSAHSGRGRCSGLRSKDVLSSGPFPPRTITPILFNNSPGRDYYINFNWLPSLIAQVEDGGCLIFFSWHSQSLGLPKWLEGKWAYKGAVSFFNYFLENISKNMWSDRFGWSCSSRQTELSYSKWNHHTLRSEIITLLLLEQCCQ